MGKNNSCIMPKAEAGLRIEDKLQKKKGASLLPLFL
jgi:hypothetical protein